MSPFQATIEFKILRLPGLLQQEQRALASTAWRLEARDRGCYDAALYHLFPSGLDGLVTGSPLQNGSKDNLVWLDLEMTGLEPEKDVIVQIAAIVTDRDLNELAEPVEYTIWHPAETMNRMTPFVRDMHERSGLLRAIQNSKTALEEAEREVLAMVSLHCEYKTARLCGNSIWQDRRFLQKYMPALENYLHYRMIDVSSIKELAGWWYGIQHRKPKGAQHTALWDTRQSIEELKFYREKMFKSDGSAEG